jgi:hypothetical protein
MGYHFNFSSFWVKKTFKRREHVSCFSVIVSPNDTSNVYLPVLSKATGQTLHKALWLWLWLWQWLWLWLWQKNKMQNRSLNQHENSRLKSRFLFYFIFQSFLRYNPPETSHFLSAQMALVSTFYQMFIELGMYNFDLVYSSCLVIR